MNNWFSAHAGRFLTRTRRNSVRRLFNVPTRGVEASFVECYPDYVEEFRSLATGTRRLDQEHVDFDTGSSMHCVGSDDEAGAKHCIADVRFRRTPFVSK